MDKTIRKKLSKSKDGFDLNPILDFMEKSGIEYRDRTLKGPLGIATFYCVFLDISKLKHTFNNKMIAYVILHETGHFKRIEKMGKEHVINMMSNTNFESFSDHIIQEEMTADRYACHIFKTLTNEYLSREITQQLNIKSNRDRYVNQTRGMFGKITNEQTYKQYLEQFVEEKK
jgi:hypothetical protein